MTKVISSEQVQALLDAEAEHARRRMPDFDEVIASASRKRNRRLIAGGAAAGLAASLVAAVGFAVAGANAPTPPAGGATDVSFPTMPKADGGALSIGYGAPLQVSSSGCPYIEVDKSNGNWPAGTYVLHVFDTQPSSLHRTTQGWQVRDSSGGVAATIGQGVMTRPLPRADLSGLKHAGACTSLIDNGALTAHVTDFAPPAGAGVGSRSGAAH